MNARFIRFSTLPVLFLLLAALPLRGDEKKPGGNQGKEEKAAAETAPAEREAAGPSAEEIIRLAESKLYSPLRDGLKDLYFVQKVALGKKYRTFWFKAPDRVKGILGRPNRHKLPPRYAKLFKRTTEPELPVQEIVAHRTVFRLLGRPMSCLLPYGTFEVIRRDENGTQLRFTADTEDTKNLAWTNIDFYLNKDFHLIRIMQKLVPDGRVEEYRIRLKPVEEGSNLMVVDTETVVSGTKEWRKAMTGRYAYKKVDGFWLLDRVEMVVAPDEKEEKPESGSTEKKEEYVEQYLDYRVNQGIDDKVFTAR